MVRKSQQVQVISGRGERGAEDSPQQVQVISGRESVEQRIAHRKQAGKQGDRADIGAG